MNEITREQAKRMLINMREDYMERAFAYLNAEMTESEEADFVEEMGENPVLMAEVVRQTDQLAKFADPAPNRLPADPSAWGWLGQLLEGLSWPITPKQQFSFAQGRGKLSGGQARGAWVATLTAPSDAPIPITLSLELEGTGGQRQFKVRIDSDSEVNGKLIDVRLERHRADGGVSAVNVRKVEVGGSMKPGVWGDFAEEDEWTLTLKPAE